MGHDRDDDADITFKHEKTRLGVGEIGSQPTLPAPSRPSVEIEVVQEKPPTLDGSRYTLGAQLGQGGMGEVVLARDEHIGRDVAIKRIRTASPNEEQVARFVREARVQGRLEHPAVVPVYDLSVDPEGRPYFVMKRLAGTEMHEVLRRMRTGEDPDEASSRRRLLRAFADVCLAIELAHQRNIVHRDLKPANIMLGDFGEVYVLDWGVARSLQSFDEDVTRVGPKPTTQPTTRLDLAALDSAETRQGTLLGTPAYMAPEQLAGDPVGPAADVYALGCILFEIAAGEPLHPRTRTAGQALSLSDARPSQRRSDSPPELDAICLRATAAEAEDRFPSARALGAAVQAYLDGNRDVAVRRELAQQHLAEARAAIARGNHDEANRVAAIRAAGRALALDPQSTEAADIVTSLMLQAPREVPHEVERELAALETATARQQGKLTSVSILGYLVFVPFLLWTGVHDPLIVAAMALLSIIGAGQIYWHTQRASILPAHVYLNVAINATLIALVVRMVGPFIIAPTLVVATLVAYAAHPLFGRIGVVSTLLVGGVFVPWFLELAGVLEPTYGFEAGKLVHESPALRFEPAPTQLAFVVLVVMVVMVVAYLLRTMALQQRDATRRLELQAWHLRQIVPAGVPSAS